MSTTKAPPADPAAFRAFMQARRGAKGRRAQPERPAPLVKPTDERLEKNDRPRKTEGGFYRAPAPIERLRDHRKLDPLPHVNEAMFQAAGKLYSVFYLGGLGGIAAQDLSRCVGGGDGGSCGFPRNERAMHNRQVFREAVKIMGWHEAFPHRGAARLVVDVICFDMAIRDASRIHIPLGRTEVSTAAGMDRLREGLFALASHWRLF